MVDHEKIEKIPAISDSAELGQTPAGVGKLLLLLIIALVFYGILHFTDWGDRVRELIALRDTLAAAGIQGMAIFIGLTTVLMGLGSPRLLFFTLGGFVFGFVNGLLLALLASLLASFINFNAFRWAGRDWVKQRFGNHRLAAAVVQLKPTALSVFIVRQLPISNVLVNLSLALSATGNRDFLLGSLFGFLPLGIAATLIGSGLADEGVWLGILQMTLAALVLLGFSVWFWQRRQNLMKSLIHKKEMD